MLRSSEISPIDQARLVGLAGGGAAQHGAHAHQQLAQPEGLGDVVVRAQIEAANDIRFLLFGGDHDHRDARFAAQVADELVAVHVGHHDVQQDQVGVGLVEDLQRLAPVGGGQHLEILAAEKIAQQHLHVACIIHHQNFALHRCIISIINDEEAGEPTQPLRFEEEKR